MGLFRGPVSRACLAGLGRLGEDSPQVKFSRNGLPVEATGIFYD